MSEQEAARAMREACAQVADGFAGTGGGMSTGRMWQTTTAREIAAAIRALPLPAPEATAEETVLRERVAVAIERAHAPQSVGSHARALWIADAVLAALAAPAEAVIDANDYTGVPKSGAVLHAERQARQAEGERAVVEAAQSWYDASSGWEANHASRRLERAICTLRAQAAAEEPTK